MDDSLLIEFECALCHRDCCRTISSENDQNDLDICGLCGLCNFLSVDGNNNTTQSLRSRYANSSIGEIFSEHLSSFESEDADIDPMHTGQNLNHRSSDEEVNEWEDGGTAENTLENSIARVQLHRSDGQTAEIEAGILVRNVNLTNPFRHSEDYLDSRSFEQLMERLAETDNTRRGPPPAALSVVNNLDFVTVNDTDHIGLWCAICKDGLTLGTVVNRLPCFHLYHTSCIKPWLSSRNTCPLCRFELPTDDVDYENTKQSRNRGLVVREIEPQEEESHEIEPQEEESHETAFEEDAGLEIKNGDGEGGTGGRRWLFVAAPVVTLVGIGVAVWLGNYGGVLGV